MYVYIYIDVCIYIYIYIYIYKLATIVEGNPKAPFSIATTPRCRGVRYSFPGIIYIDEIDRCIYRCICVYIYRCIYIYRERE